MPPAARPPKNRKTRPPPTPDQVLRRVLDLVMQGNDPGLASEVIAASRDVGLGPTDDEIAAWIGRIEQSQTTPYDALMTAIRTLDEAGDLVDALVAAASREGVAPPADQPWMEGFDWSSVEREVRWEFVRIAVEDAASASELYSDDLPAHDSLGAYLQVVLPTLIPEAIDRLEWWFEHARAVSRNRDTDLYFGMHTQSVADEWLGEAAKGSLPTLLRLAVLLQRPVWGASTSAAGTLQIVYERIGEALPPRRKGRGKLKARVRSAGRTDSAT